MRLIDADALKYEPLPRGDRNYRTYNLDDAYDDGYDDAFVDIRNAPTVDAVPVTHCKDCVWFINNILKADGTDDRRFKRRWCEFHRFVTHDYGYCHWAERKEE